MIAHVHVQYLLLLVSPHCMLTVPPAVSLGMSTSSLVPSARERTNRQPLAEPLPANTQYRDTVVLRNVMLALWTSLVAGGIGGGREGGGERGGGGERERERERERGGGGEGKKRGREGW